MMLVKSLSGLECFRSPFPKVLGSTLDETVYNAIDIYPTKEDIVAVGHTSDMNVKGGSTATNQSPLIVFYSGVSFTMAWGRVLDIASYIFNSVAFSADG